MASASSTTEQVIELSVEETNKLRAELGLKPLRVNAESKSASTQKAENGTTATNTAPSKNDEVLELSVEDTNALRAKLGLPPLRFDKNSSESSNGPTRRPAPNLGHDAAVADRIAKSRLKREVEQGISKWETKSIAELSKQSGSKNAADGIGEWAKRMRKKKQEASSAEETGATEKAAQQDDAAGNESYTAQDLQGMTVAHAASDFDAGATAVLTLADTELVETDQHSKKAIKLVTDDDPENAPVLENASLMENNKQQDRLREKRKVELGRDRAGGYAGFDDDEFLELGGVGPSRETRGGGWKGGPSENLVKEGRRRRKKGFQIGSALDEQDEIESDLFAAQQGRAISLHSGGGPVIASDYMTVEEDSKRRKKDGKFKKKKKSKKDKKKKGRSKVDSDEEIEQDDTGAAEQTNFEPIKSEVGNKGEDLDEKSSGQKREIDEIADVRGALEQDVFAVKRAKYAAAMAKGAQRTKAAFAAPLPAARNPAVFDDDEPDDAFLSAALAKARRLNQLHQVSKQRGRGEDALLETVTQAASLSHSEQRGEADGNLVFEKDETREFTRAILAREQQTDRQKAKKPAKTESIKVDEAPSHDITPITVNEEDEGDQMEGIEKLAKQIEDEPDDTALDGTTGTAISVGRGLGSVLNILKQTGDLTRKNAGLEEQRGRAKDERTYEDYEQMDLSSVVQIDERTATDKDKEIAKRQVKLEYRDKHGRLLTRKEAFRDLSYQFHGYGSGKRKQEKKLQQIAREQAEQRLKSKQAAQGGIFGALKATQKATGKAFIVHKT